MSKNLLYFLLAITLISYVVLLFSYLKYINESLELKKLDSQIRWDDGKVKKPDLTPVPVPANSDLLMPDEFKYIKDGIFILHVWGHMDRDMYDYIRYSVELAVNNYPNLHTIRTYFHTGGGAITPSLKAIIYLIDTGLKLEGVVTKKCFSACVLMFSAMDKRIMKEGSELMIHAPKRSCFRSYVSLRTLKLMYPNIKKGEKIWCDRRIVGKEYIRLVIYQMQALENTIFNYTFFGKFSRDFYNKMMSSGADYYFDREDSILFNLADDIDYEKADL